MGVLSINEESDTLAYIRDVYDIMIGVSHLRLYGQALTEVGVDGSTISDLIAECLYKQPIIHSEQEVVDKVLLWSAVQFFKRKYENGLEKKFTTKWQQTDRGWIVLVTDDNTNTHIRCIMTRKGSGLLHRVKDGMMSLVKNFYSSN